MACSVPAFPPNTLIGAEVEVYIHVLVFNTVGTQISMMGKEGSALYLVARYLVQISATPPFLFLQIIKRPKDKRRGGARRRREEGKKVQIPVTPPFLFLQIIKRRRGAKEGRARYKKRKVME